MPRSKAKKKKQQQDGSTSDTTNVPSQSQSTSQQPQQQQQQQRTEPQKTPQPSVEKPQQAPQVPQQQLQGAWAKRSEQQQVPAQPSQGWAPHQQQIPTHPAQGQPQGTQMQPQQQQQMPVHPSQAQRAQMQQQQQMPVHPSQAQRAQMQQQQQIPTHPTQHPQAAGMQPPQQQQPLGAWNRPAQQQQQTPTHPAQYPQAAGMQPLQQQQIPAHSAQQQPQRAWAPQQQQIPTYPAQGQPQGTWMQPPRQQQMPGHPSQPQRAQLQQQQQPPTHPAQHPQAARMQPPQQQQQIPTHPAQHPQAAGMQPPQQQPPLGAWNRPAQQQQQSPTHPAQHPQAPGMQPPQQQPPLGAWNRAAQQQQHIPTQPSQQQPRGAQKQQQKGSGDFQQTQVARRHADTRSQPSTSVESVKISGLNITDIYETPKTSKPKMTAAEIKKYQSSIPRRQHPTKGGTVGTKIKVSTNLFEILTKNFATNAVHYDVEITPKAPKLIFKKVFEQCRQANFNRRCPAFDGKKNAYSANDLPFNDHMVAEIDFYDNERDKHVNFKIVLTKVGVVDLSWIRSLKPGVEEDKDQSNMQVLDIIMRHAMESKYFSVGRSFYWNIDVSKPLGRGLCLGQGGFTSAVAGWKPYLNVDVANKGFPSPKNVVDIMCEFTRGGTIEEIVKLNSWEKEKMEKYFKGIKVIYEIPKVSKSKRTYRINGLGPSAYAHKFECKGKWMTTADYFELEKNCKLVNPFLPCLWVGAVDRKEKIYLPAELCTITCPQSYNKKLDDQQTTNMIRKTATPAYIRKKNIEAAFREIDVNRSATVRQEFGLQVETKMKEVDARVLPPPTLKYAKSKLAEVSKGVWSMNEFKQAAELRKWALVDASKKERSRGGYDRYGPIDLPEFRKQLMEHASKVGMLILSPTFESTVYTRQMGETTNFFEECKKAKCQLIIVVVPDATDSTYSYIKQLTELRLGILTQCVKAETVRKITKGNLPTLKNILLKINSKINGVNHVFNEMPICLKNSNCMLVGADVTHPSPDAVRIPSIAAVAASQDTEAFKYNTELRLQTAKEEMIVDLENIIISQINTYTKETKNLPQKIIYYRDGVSEGQLPQVMYYEIEAIRRACKKFQTPKDIEITCLVVQKRHHVRLFPTNPKETDDRGGNVRAGTIVDTEITHPSHIDFYLVSHASIQGTARPTKYRCICNDSNYTEDQIEQMTYYLCHMYARCTRSVSYPAPTYYAHLAAYRGRTLINGININMDNLKSEQEKLKMKMGETPMFFI